MTAREGEGLGDTDDTVLHELSDDDWQQAHEALMGDGSPIPDEQLVWTVRPGRTGLWRGPGRAT